MIQAKRQLRRALLTLRLAIERSFNTYDEFRYYRFGLQVGHLKSK